MRGFIRSLFQYLIILVVVHMHSTSYTMYIDYFFKYIKESFSTIAALVDESCSMH